MTRSFSLTLMFAFLAGSVHLCADEAISVTVRPAVTMVGSAQVKVLIERNSSNRELLWEVDGPNFYRSSALQLEGAFAPRSFFFVVKDMPEGEFEVRATVRRNDDSQSMERRTIRVVGGKS
jgi:hypothetical protein